MTVKKVKMAKHSCSKGKENWEESMSETIVCDCAEVAGRRVDELLEQLEEMRDLASGDQEELRRLRARASDSREQGPACDSGMDSKLAEVFRNLASSFESMVTSRQMRFEDVEKSFKTFSGNGSRDISDWINQFSEQAELFELSEFQRFAYAKRLMRETAKLFVDNESKAKTWTELQCELRSEFGKRVNSAFFS